MASLTPLRIVCSFSSPNGTIRNILNGTVFREPIICQIVKRPVPGWTAPIVVGRHAHADQYRSQGLKVEGGGELELVFTPAQSGQPAQRLSIHKFGPTDSGVGLGMFNTAQVSQLNCSLTCQALIVYFHWFLFGVLKKQSIDDFAHSSFKMAISKKIPMVRKDRQASIQKTLHVWLMNLWSQYLSTKNTILKAYDGMWKDRFQEIYDRLHFNKSFKLNQLVSLTNHPTLRQAIQTRIREIRDLVRASIDRWCEYSLDWRYSDQVSCFELFFNPLSRWWHKWSNPLVDSSWHWKTTMEMSNQILLHRSADTLWFPSARLCPLSWKTFSCFFFPYIGLWVIRLDDIGIGHTWWGNYGKWSSSWNCHSTLSRIPKGLNAKLLSFPMTCSWELSLSVRCQSTTLTHEGQSDFD